MRYLVSGFKIGRTIWEIYSTGEHSYQVEKNGKEWSNGNGPEYESETEAEINILLEYKVR